MMNELKTKVKLAEKTFKSTKKNHFHLYNNLRNELIRTIIKSDTPNFGSFKVTVTKNGI